MRTPDKPTKIIQFVGNIHHDMYNAISAIQDADIVINRLGIVIKDHTTNPMRQATPEELRQAEKLAS